MSIEGAIVARLAGDGALTALAPGGVWLEPAPDGIPEPYVVVGLQTSEDFDVLGGERAIEAVEYLVKAVGAGPSGGAVEAAARRIDEVLHNGTLTLESGSLMAIGRRERVRYVEDGEAARFQHAGGVYAVSISS